MESIAKLLAASAAMIAALALFWLAVTAHRISTGDARIWIDHCEVPWRLR